MRVLDIDRINRVAPYDVMFQNGKYVFKTDASIVFSVQFEQETELDNGYPVYWFHLINSESKPSPRDSKVRDTIICIIEEFFCDSPDVLLYLCDSAGGQQAMRNRLFLRWFDTYELKERFLILNEKIITDGQEDYVSLIIRRNHPQLEEISKYFQGIVALFKANKP